MAGRYAPKTVLAQLIQRRNQTYSEIVAEFVELGGTITERHLRRLASGERAGTTPQTRRTLQRMFGKPVEELLAPYSPEQAAQVVPAPAALVVPRAVCANAGVAAISRVAVTARVMGGVEPGFRAARESFRAWPSCASYLGPRGS